MAKPHHDQQNPASGTHASRSTSASSTTARNPLRRAVEALPPPIFALPFIAFVLAAIAIYFLSSRHDPAPNSVHSTPLDLLSIPASTYSEPKGTMSSTEQTFIAIKPDGVQRGLVGPIISRFENRGFKLAAIKLVTPSKEHLEAHYADLKGKPFFDGLIKYMLSGPICAMVWEGRDAVKTGRSKQPPMTFFSRISLTNSAILGATNPLASAPGTIRGDYAIDVGRNVCHGSDSVENAKKEIALWFKEGDVVSYKQSQFDWIYEKA
ncbi:nucleoside diphosphate kinase A [Metarhizium acridum CQMa 102]|uniref:Nucleoside diphosphate kinase n=1 Tax=Metarhizium acridum (strain CQMa 102) TaxID=655827 RepID=E9EDB8_METAQ|nr:nucleoside diphosphate kinase A [Metarhizium acridum CQMa 102]EFY86058.1 nucleoside diphosphate kinase A [Metarhizium acridum CQMa 102]